jgi:hypothetical protein
MPKPKGIASRPTASRSERQDLHRECGERGDWHQTMHMGISSRSFVVLASTSSSSAALCMSFAKPPPRRRSNRHSSEGQGYESTEAENGWPFWALVSISLLYGHGASLGWEPATEV